MTSKYLSNYDHPLVQETSARLTANHANQAARLASIFHFVRDKIEFGFPPVWDEVQASRTLEYGMGYCNTKATLFHALCKAAGIPSRIHTSLIDLEIMRGIFPGFIFPFLPEAGGHSWVEVKINHEWISIDSYINDKPFYINAHKMLLKSGKSTSFSISEAGGPASCELHLEGKGFVHMGAVRVDHGTWDDFSEYMASDQYFAMEKLHLLLLPLIARESNRQIRKIRAK